MASFEGMKSAVKQQAESKNLRKASGQVGSAKSELERPTLMDTHNRAQKRCLEDALRTQLLCWFEFSRVCRIAVAAAVTGDLSGSDSSLVQCWLLHTGASSAFLSFFVR